MCNIWLYTHKEKQHNILTAVVDLQGGADLSLLGYLNKSHWLSPCTLRDLSYGGYLADQRWLIPSVKRAFIITLEWQSETGHPCHLACVSPPSFTSACSTRWCIIFNQNHLQFPQSLQLFSIYGHTGMSQTIQIKVSIKGNNSQIWSQAKLNIRKVLY